MMHPLPDPSKMKVGKEDYIDLPAGTELHRIHPTRFGSAQFNDTALGDARFSPIRNAAGAIIPTIYGGESFECAVCEIILRCPDTATAKLSPLSGNDIVYPADFEHYSHSVVRTAMDLKLVDVTNKGQRAIGINHNALLSHPSSSYPKTRDWAMRIHEACPAAHGLYYSSYQYGPQFAVLLFGDRFSSPALEAVSKREVSGRECHDDIHTLAASLSIDYEDV